MADAEQLNVLVIDDDEDVRRLLADVIASGEHQVVCASSAEEGLELLPYWTFQVAFLDHNLPGMDGLVLGAYLRRNNPDMAIALVTGADDEKLPKQSRELGIRFLPKPFDVADVQTILATYIEEAKERRQQRLEQESPDYGPPLATYADEVTDSYGIPKVPNRVQTRLVDTLKRSLNNLRTISRYTERDRAIALSGLISAKVLGLDLPKASSGRSLYEEYDAIMLAHGRRPEFGAKAATA